MRTRGEFTPERATVLGARWAETTRKPDVAPWSPSSFLAALHIREVSIQSALFTGRRALDDGSIGKEADPSVPFTSFG